MEYVQYIHKEDNSNVYGTLYFQPPIHWFLSFSTPRFFLHHMTDLQKKYQFLCILSVTKLNLCSHDLFMSTLYY